MSDRKRQITRVRREQVVNVTIVLTIDAKIEDGKLLIGVAQAQPIVAQAQPIEVGESSLTNHV